ncbi:uncharacterized protein KY384_005586 [Bacidia gigantensis]|uniref:uncharacterized protein n=1 Tax=Bacidia gigantensis TaxID=2732470 RepID=UPI001D03A40B|nr:uncharacterized protein KY384_005586 [Bacidia gigantensis]KAG8530104.1 hypothetical protein KY384_005586 [Bacidia gigantensis]
MSTQVMLPLPVLPPEWKAEKDFLSKGSLSTPIQRNIEPVGPHFLAHARRLRHRRTFSEDERIQAQEKAQRTEQDSDADISEPEDPVMLSRDAKDWKGQDHYAVLGLSNFRWQANEAQIKRAHRKKVLRHHPDKKAAAGSSEDDSFFKCIQKATEVLLDPVKRRQFDSVDEEADVPLPSKKQLQKGNFYKLWNPVFDSEARFTKSPPAPHLGDEKSAKEDVTEFYDYWYNFDSWRSFEYQDEDVPDDNENRDQKRHVERKNNNARKKKKTEDTARLRNLVDQCIAGDERIKKFRQEEKADKNKKRLDRETAEKKAIEDKKKAAEEQERMKKESEETAKAERAEGKKAKEAAKNAVKKNKRVLKGSVKDANYLLPAGAKADTKQIDGVSLDIEIVMGKMEPEDIANLAGKLSGLKVAEEVAPLWQEEVKRLREVGKLKEGDAKTLVP